MQVDPDEVKWHLGFLGFKNIQPNMLNEFIKDLEKLIEYDRKYKINILSKSYHKKQDQNYSEKFKSNTPVNNIINDSPITVSSEPQCIQLKKKKMNHNCNFLTSSKHMNHLNQHNTNRSNNYTSENTTPKCNFCEYIQTKNQPARGKVNHYSNPSHTIHIGATFHIEM